MIFCKNTHVYIYIYKYYVISWASHFQPCSFGEALRPAMLMARAAKLHRESAWQMVGDLNDSKKSPTGPAFHGPPNLSI